jgi:hypothetical protein
MPKNANIRAVRYHEGISLYGPMSVSTSLKAKGDHHAPQVLSFHGNGRHCRGCCQRHHFNVDHADISPGSGALRCNTRLCSQNALGEPDLQGIWTDENDTPLQRPAKYANQEFFTEAQRAELDRARSEVLGSDKRGERGTEFDLAGAYNSAFVSWKRAGARTSLIVDPPNGRIPPLTPAGQKIAAAEREYRLVLLQATDACKTNAPISSGGKYDPTPSPRRAESPPRYNTGGMNRNDGPEDSSLAERCLTGGLPEFGGGVGSFRRIVQTPGGITIFYDVGQGQGWQRNIVMNASPHLPANIRQWYGDLWMPLIGEDWKLPEAADPDALYPIPTAIPRATRPYGMGSETR